VEKDPVTKDEKFTPSPAIKKSVSKKEDPFKSSNEIKRTFYVANTEPSILDIPIKPSRFVSRLP
jgi:hypothetical protein